MNSVNVFITSVWRRVELVQLFKNTANKLGINSKIIGGDCSVFAPALRFVDEVVILPKVNSKDYIESIIKACIEHEIRIIVPTIDTELQIFSNHKKYILDRCGAKVFVSDSDIIEVCNDKILFSRFLSKNGFNVPTLYEDITTISNENFPLFMKPLDGSSSKNANKIDTPLELNLFHKLTEKPMIQEFIEGDEYTVDVFVGKDNNIVSIVPRLRMEVRSGEISKGKIILNQDIINEVQKLISKLKPFGQITVQVIRNDNGIFFIEVNPRFGGGSPMSIMSGANSCEFVYLTYMNKDIDFTQTLISEDIYLRYDQSVKYNEK